VGSQLEILTNKALTSGLHRVVRGPGEQHKFDRYSVLVGTREANHFSMKPLQGAQISPVLDAVTAEIAKLTSGQWGSLNVGGFDKYVSDRTERKEVLIVP
jgi:isopenicillin N synthase-like dioxygenase